MFKKTLGFVAAATVVAGLGLATSTTANAATSPAETNANVTLNAGAGDKGAVTLESAPNIDFGTDNTLTGSAIKAKGTLDNDLIVNNAGDTTGWTVTLSSSALSNGTDTLTGSTYQLTGDATAITSPTDTTADTGNNSGKPTVEGTTVNGDGTTDNKGAIFSAAAGDGVGTWAAKLNAPTLNVPASAKSGAYTSTLTWTLNNAAQ